MLSFFTGLYMAEASGCLPFDHPPDPVKDSGGSFPLQQYISPADDKQCPQSCQHCVQRPLQIVHSIYIDKKDKRNHCNKRQQQ